MDDLLCRGKPLLDLSGLELFPKAAKCVLTTKSFFFHAGDFGYGPIILEATVVGETCPAGKGVEGEGLENVDDRSGVRAGARQGLVFRESIKHSSMLQKVIPGHQAAIGGERFIAAS
jgi:hypothetical protein